MDYLVPIDQARLLCGVLSAVAVAAFVLTKLGERRCDRLAALLRDVRALRAAERRRP